MERPEVEMMDLYGKKADGTEEFLGFVPMSPELKIPVLAQAYGFDSLDRCDGELAVAAMHDLVAWMKNQGWKAPPMNLNDSNSSCSSSD